MNIHGDDLEPFVYRPPFSSRRKRLVDPRGAGGDPVFRPGAGGFAADASSLARARIGASVWEIAPHSTQIPFHFHHVQEELVVVLRGRLVLRTKAGERELREGDVEHFPTGPDGAHALRNESDEAARVLWISELADAEIAEYPESGKVRVMTRGASQSGERLAAQFRLDEAVEYLDGE